MHIIEDRLLWLDIAIAIAHILWTMAIAQNVQPSALPGQACISTSPYDWHYMYLELVSALYALRRASQVDNLQRSQHHLMGFTMGSDQEHWVIRT